MEQVINAFTWYNLQNTQMGTHRRLTLPASQASPTDVLFVMYLFRVFVDKSHTHTQTYATQNDHTAQSLQFLAFHL